MITQCDRIVVHIEKYGKIDSHTAQECYGIARLASRINDLKKQGYEIETKTVKGINRFGDKCHWTEYSFKEEE